MDNMSIRAKIFGLIIFAAIVVGLVGYIGIKNIHAIDDADTMLYEKMLVPISQLGDISVYYQRTRINLRDIIIANADEKIKKYGENLKDIEEKMVKSENEYEKGIISPEMRTLFDQYKSLNKQYDEKFTAKVTELALANKDTEALEIMQSDEALRIAGSLQETIDKMTEMKARQAKQTADDNTKMADSASNYMIGLIIAGVILALFVGWLIVANVYAVLGFLVAEAQKLTAAVNEGKLDPRRRG